MEILDPSGQQYGQQFNQFRPPQQDRNGFLINLIMKVSGGRINNPRQAGYMLAILCVIIIILAIYLLNSNGEPPKNAVPAIHGTGAAAPR